MVVNRKVNIEELIVEPRRSLRPKVEIPLFPVRGTGWVQEHGQEAYNELVLIWRRELDQKIFQAVALIAKDTDADIDELMKVCDYIVELVPPKMSGQDKRYQDEFSLMLSVAGEMRKGKNQRIACELTGIDPKTFRKYRDMYPNAWATVRDLIESKPI